VVSHEEQWSDIEDDLYQSSPLSTVRHAPSRSSARAEVAFLFALIGIPTSLAAWLFFYVPLIALGLGIAAFALDFPKGRTGHKLAGLAIGLGVLEVIVVIMTTIAASHYRSY
jgi:hypothetical protein